MILPVHVQGAHVCSDAVIPRVIYASLLGEVKIL